MKNDKFKGSRQTLYLSPSVLCAGCGLRARCPLRSSSSTKTSLNNLKDTTLHFCAQAVEMVRVRSLQCTRNARSGHFRWKSTIVWDIWIPKELPPTRCLCLPPGSLWGSSWSLPGTLLGPTVYEKITYKI